MTVIVLVRQSSVALTEPEKAAARRVLFGAIDGLGDKGRRQWRRFMNTLLRLEPGEMVTLRTHKARSGLAHRCHMLMEQRVFEAQERFDSFEQFRNWLKVGAGFCDWCAGPKGGVIPIPKSIAFDKLEEDDMAQVHEDMVAFLRGVHAPRYLWRHLSDAQAGTMMETILSELGQ